MQTPLPAAALAAVVALSTSTACGPSVANKSTPPAAETISKKSSFLSRIPADTPYVWATLAPWPRGYWEWAYLDQAEKYDRALKLLRRAQKNHPAQFAQLGPGLRLLYAAISEFEGKLDAAGLLSLGLKLDTQMAIYGIGAYPVMRFELHDGSLVRSLVSRVLREAKFEVRSERIAGVEYWRFPSGEFTAIAAIVKNEALLALLPSSTFTEHLPLVLE